MPESSPEHLPKKTDSQPVASVAVIGAGISGLIASKMLQDDGIKVTVFEKARGVGGRMSTRRIGNEEDGLTFDHGAQYFTARDQHFIRYVDSWIENGLVAKWPDRELGRDQKIVVMENGAIKSESNSEVRFVAVPTMTAICKHLASDLDVQTQTRVEKVNSVNGGIELLCDSGHSLGKFDRLIVTAPAAQTAELLVNFPAMAKSIFEILMNPCWATMVAFETPVTNEWVGAFLHGSFLSWAARNSTKPGRDKDAEHVVIHANPEWTAEHWEDDPNSVAEVMLAEFFRVTGMSPLPNTSIKSHRWKYAIPSDSIDVNCFADDSGRVFASGDWAANSRVEGAFLSGVAAADLVQRSLTR